MILYLDTALLLSLHLYDSKTEVVTQALSRDKYEFAMSGWATTEAASALGILVRRKELESKLATEVLEGLELLASESQILNIDY
jgi:predicted nucleic acid-binding protein